VITVMALDEEGKETVAYTYSKVGFRSVQYGISLDRTGTY